MVKIRCRAQVIPDGGVNWPPPPHQARVLPGCTTRRASSCLQALELLVFFGSCPLERFLPSFWDGVKCNLSVCLLYLPVYNVFNTSSGSYDLGNFAFSPPWFSTILCLSIPDPCHLLRGHFLGLVILPTFLRGILRKLRHFRNLWSLICGLCWFASRCIQVQQWTTLIGEFSISDMKCRNLFPVRFPPLSKPPPCLYPSFSVLSRGGYSSCIFCIFFA